MAAVQKGTSVIWSVNGLTAVAVAATSSNIEQSFSKSNSSDSKEILGDEVAPLPIVQIPKTGVVLVQLYQSCIHLSLRLMGDVILCPVLCTGARITS